MKIEIISRFTSNGREFFEWDLFDGPADYSDHAHGYASDLITAFSKIMEWHERIGADYAEEVLKDLDTLKTYLDNTDETLT
jgi:hypothetical protein